MRRLAEAFRWLLVLPVAAAAYLGILLEFTFLRVLGVPGIPDAVVVGFSRLFAIVVGTMVFIAAGTGAAPRARSRTATALGAIQVAGAVVWAYMVWRAAGLNLGAMLVQGLPGGLDPITHVVWWEYLTCVLSATVAVITTKYQRALYSPLATNELTAHDDREATSPPLWVSLRRGMGMAMQWTGYAVYAIASVSLLSMLLPPVYSWLAHYIGYFAVIVVMMLTPIILLVGPFYHGLAHGWWQPLLVCYGGAALATVLVHVGDLMSTKTA